MLVAGYPREVMAVGPKQPVKVRQWREWARTLPLLLALPMVFLLMGLMMRACGPVAG